MARDGDNIVKVQMNEAETRGREYLRSKGRDGRIIDFKNTDITVESTALALDVDVDRIEFAYWICDAIWWYMEGNI